MPVEMSIISCSRQSILARSLSRHWLKYLVFLYSASRSILTHIPHSAIVTGGDWLWNPANFKGVLYCFGFDVETYHHVTLTLHSLFQSKMAGGIDFLDGDDLEAI